MDAKDSFVFFVLLLVSFGLLTLTYCVWNKQAEVTRELADLQIQLNKLPEELLIKGQLKRNVRQADEDTDSPLAEEIRNALTEINEMKLLLADYMNCSKSEDNHTKCALKPGHKGEPGDTGPPGTQGIAGPVGPKGDTGLQGPEGPPSEKGTKGEPGSMGQKGNPGDKGMKGNVGYTGFKGEKGREGVVGLTGPSGPQGLPGIQGKDGSKGEQGVVGAKGDMGERGLKGDMGPPGPQGETGGKGDMGQKGEAGTKGVMGIQGYTGFKGEKGQKGVASPQGPLSLPTTAPITVPTMFTSTQCGGEQCGGPGWRRVVLLDLTNTSHVCPPGLKFTPYSRRTCGRAHSGRCNCSSTTFSVGGSQYRRVCGRALAYRWGQNTAFYGYHRRGQDIDGYYVDGLSLTHGAPGSRQHIWTFASGLFTGCRSSIHPDCRCPCNNGYTYRSPSFVGSDYFCESTRTECNWHEVDRFRLYPDATLWDGQVCEGGGTCCQLHNPPWFTKNLAIPTSDSIELRLCMLERSSVADVALELLELYVQ